MRPTSGVLRPALLATLLLAASALARGPSEPAPVIRNGVSFVMAQALVKASVQNGVRAEQFIQSPRAVQAGDLLREQVTVHNVRGQSIAQVTVGIPIPRETVFSGGVTPDSPRWTVAYSADGGRTYSPRPLQDVTVTENGKAVTRSQPAPPESYTHVRWTVAGLKKDETLKLEFRVRVR